MRIYNQYLSTLMFIVFINFNIYSQNNIQEGITDSIFNSIKKLPDSLKIKILRTENVKYREKGDYVNSIFILKELLKLQNTFIDSSKKYKFRIPINGNIGLCYNHLGLSSKAISYSTKALLDAEKIKDTVSIVLSLWATSNQYADLNLLHLAKKNSFKALKYSNEIDNDNLKRVIYNSLGNIYHDLELKDSAIYYYKKANLFSKKVTGEPAYTVFMNIGNLFFNNDLDSALYYYNKAKKGISSTNTLSSNSTLFNNFAELYIKQNKLDTAEEYVFKSLKIALPNKYYEQIIASYKLLGLIYTKKRDYNKSLEYQKKYTELKDSITSINQQTSVSRVELLYKIENKKVELQKSEAISKLKTAKLKGLLIISFIIFFVAVIVFFQKRKIKKAYNLIVKDNIDSKNLHEEITSLRIELNKVKEIKYDIEEEKRTINDNKNKVLTEKQTDYIEYQIMKTFDEDKIYLNNELTINILADSIKSNRNYVSYVFNTRIKKSFSDLLNIYRVNEAKKILLSEEGTKYTFEAIAKKSGFNSKTTFNRSFKKITGITPSFFLKTAKNNNLFNN